MEVNIKTKYEVGTTLYYLYHDKIKEVVIENVKIEYWSNPMKLKIGYYIDGRWCLEDNLSEYYESKADIIKQLVEQL